MSVIGASNSYSSFFASSGAAGWLGDTLVAIQNSQHSGGIMGALSASYNGTVSSFLRNSAMIADNLALIAQGSVTSQTDFIVEIAARNQQKAQEKLIAKVAKDLLESQRRVKKENVLDPVIYFSDGSTLDTVNNILTRVDGTRYDAVTGAKYVDPLSVIQLANGAYLDTKNNILTMSDGTQIDTVTGLKILV